MCIFDYEFLHKIPKSSDDTRSVLTVLSTGDLTLCRPGARALRWHVAHVGA